MPEQLSNSQQPLKTTKLNKIFAIFLDKLSYLVTKRFFREFALLITLYRLGLNSLGWQKLKEKKNVSIIDDKQEFCQVNNGEYAPEICNEFASMLLPKYLKQCNIMYMELLGMEDVQRKNSIYFIMHFCNWLFFKFYTNEKITLNLQID